MIAIDPPCSSSRSPVDRVFSSVSSSPIPMSPGKSSKSTLFARRSISSIPPALTLRHRSTEISSEPDVPDRHIEDIDERLTTSNAPSTSTYDVGPPNQQENHLQVNGTATTSESRRSTPPLSQELTLQTSDIDNRRADDEDPQSVILAPSGFSEFSVADSPRESTSSSAHDSDITVQALRINNNKSASPVSPPPLTTKVAPWSDRATPRAQTRQEIDAFGRKPRPNSLEDIPESIDHESTQDETTDDESQIVEQYAKVSGPPNREAKALKTALSECWTLCNTLANLSSIHRDRLFQDSGRGSMQEQAWKSCWKLCQNLYDNRDNDFEFHVRPTLDLCREFCQALFEIRIKDNEIGDSILRVSFELNNHLYNTHDRNLPEAFRERTLDFYITLCHRLMKQRTQLAEETDSLLRACWSLAEMLFNLRQSRREGKLADEELLGSAVQACWDLCDLFREGWTQVRPDRRTPRPSQASFTQAFYQAREIPFPPPSDSIPTPNPETPTTIFDDTATMLSPDQAQVPNILVLGAGNAQALHPSWNSSTTSTLAGYSRPASRSSTTSSTHTVKSPADDPNLVCLKLLIVRTAMNNGFQRGGTHSLPSFAKTLSSDAFGSLPWQTSLLNHYKKLVTLDPAFSSEPPPARATAMDIARAVQVMVQHSGQYSWLLDLYRLVFGFRTDEAIHGSSVAIQT